jgi:hypothetical protein
MNKGENEYDEEFCKLCEILIVWMRLIFDDIILIMFVYRNIICK